MQDGIVLKPGKDKAIRNRHHWIFSGAIARSPKFADGDILRVYSHDGVLLGSGYFNRQAQIIGRMLCFDESPAIDGVVRHLKNAIGLRRRFFDPKVTNAYRLVNGEGDYLPGLIVDSYRDQLVIQISTVGMEKLRQTVVDTLVKELSPKGIFEKSILPTRKEEGLADFQQLLHGEIDDQVEILENGLRFFVSIKEGQKTGFFLDHREMRNAVRALSKGKRVLNCFSYTGGFSVYAAAGGASAVTSMDISEPAIEAAKVNAALNDSKNCKHTFVTADVFAYLRENALDYDIVILDPPAFAKKKKDIIPACRGYKDINRIAMQKMPSDSLLLTCSCSYFVDELLFQKVVFQACTEAKREVRIIGRHHMAVDHPVNLCHPESEYLKSLLLHLT